MRPLAAIILIALATAGCIGSTSPSTSNGRSDGQGLTVLKTDMTISYTVPACPPGARCALNTTGVNNYIVRRHLTCSPDGGDYDDPAAVCRALRDIVNQHRKHPVVCACIRSQFPPPEAVGVYRGKRQVIPLDWCSLCGVQGVGADLQLLLPGAPG
jgi:hypothetical protein